MWSFYKNLIRYPRSIGAIAPSSRYLSMEMAKCVPKDTNYTVELGAGTGSITKALLREGVIAEKLVVIDNSLDLVRKLKKSFPKVRVIHGDATHLYELLKQHHIKPSVIVSSLPLTIFPTISRLAIAQQVDQVLPNGGHYIQFSYSLRKSIFETRPRLKKTYTKRIWMNLPPARVDVFKVK